MIDNILVQVAVGTPIVIGLVEVVKRAVGLESRFAPAVSLALGIGVFYLLGSWSLQMNILGGLLVGLSASGLYAGGKATINAE